jgi:putative DNA primase/helicase
MAKNKSDLKSKILDSLDIPDFYRQHLVDFGATNNKGYATALCPFHDDHNPSLSINLETGYFHCFACGQKGSVFDFYARQHGHGMDFRTSLTDLARITGNFEEDNTKAQEGHIKIVRAYNYTDEKGKLLFQIVRSKNKVFRARKPQGKGNWEWGVEGIDLVPFNLPAVYGAKTVYIVEGEKDAQNLEKLGLTATCNPFGALKWRSEFRKHFNNKRIVILPDNDETGRKHAQQVAKSLGASSRSTKIVDLPGLSPKGDVSDWIKAGARNVNS